MELDQLSKFISAHGAWAALAIVCGGANVWIMHKLLASWEARLHDLQSTIPLLKDVASTLDTQAKLLENFIAEIRARP